VLELDEDALKDKAKKEEDYNNSKRYKSA